MKSVVICAQNDAGLAAKKGIDRQIFTKKKKCNKTALFS